MSSITQARQRYFIMKVLTTSTVSLILWLSLSSCKSAHTTEKSQKLSGSSGMDSPMTSNPYYSTSDTLPLNLEDSVWKKVLTPQVYRISRRKDTEYPFSGKYWNFEGIGTYYCAACGNALFKSNAKFSSTCGWPSFYESIRPKSVLYIPDHSEGMQRTEVVCGRCHGHLGHIFDDGPPPTGKRFCMNSLALHFIQQK